jgi:hypothetical protein
MMNTAHTAHDVYPEYTEDSKKVRIINEERRDAAPTPKIHW